MKGYRTIIFSALMTLAGMIGWKVNPAAANNWVDVFLSVWGIGAILLRQITTGPVGNPALVSASASLLSDGDMAAIRSDLQTVLAHVKITPTLAAATGNISDKFDLIAQAIQAVATANAVVAPQVVVAPAAAPVATPPVAEQPVAPAVPVVAPAPVVAAPPVMVAPPAPAILAAAEIVQPVTPLVAQVYPGSPAS